MTKNQSADEANDVTRKALDAGKPEHAALPASGADASMTKAVTKKTLAKVDFSEKPPPARKRRVKAFDPWTATVEQAIDAQASFVGPSYMGPIFRHDAATKIAAREQRCRQDGYEVLRCVHLCAWHGLVMPPWLAQAFLKRFRRVNDCKVDSWDKAFGKPFPKGAQVRRLRFRRETRCAAAVAAHDIISKDPHRAIDKAFFTEVGRAIGAGASLAEELYREAVRLGAVDVARLKRRRLAGEF